MGFFNRFLLTEIAAIGAVCAPAMATSMFSQYGQIQNVQNYSSNPYWNPNGPYNQRTMPTPVYAQGAELNAGDCTRAVSALVASYCVTRDGCARVSLDDARPTLMIQLAALPNHNYVTSCAGFIDSEFAKYKAARGNAGAAGNRVVEFPDATGPAVTDDQNIEMKNPFAKPKPQWAVEMGERAAELEQLQAQNGAGDEQLVATAFPKTAADLSFGERNQILAAGYEPYKDKSGYQPINVGSAEEYEAWRDSKEAKEKAAKATAAKANKDKDGKNDGGKKDKDVPGKKAAADLGDLSWIVSLCGEESTKSDVLKQKLEREISLMKNETYCKKGRFLDPYNSSINDQASSCSLIKKLARAPKNMAGSTIDTDSDSGDRQFDPVRQKNYCCDVFDSTAADLGCSGRILEGGGKIFCGSGSNTTTVFYGMVRVCKEGGWLEIASDYFVEDCTEGFCDGTTPPMEDYWNADTIDWTPGEGVCWKWAGTNSTLMLYKRAIDGQPAYPVYYKDEMPEDEGLRNDLQNCDTWRAALESVLDEIN